MKNIPLDHTGHEDRYYAKTQMRLHQEYCASKKAERKKQREASSAQNCAVCGYSPSKYVERWGGVNKKGEEVSYYEKVPLLVTDPRYMCPPCMAERLRNVIAKVAVRSSAKQLRAYLRSKRHGLHR